MSSLDRSFGQPARHDIRCEFRASHSHDRPPNGGIARQTAITAAGSDTGNHWTRSAAFVKAFRRIRTPWRYSPSRSTRLNGAGRTARLRVSARAAASEDQYHFFKAARHWHLERQDARSRVRATMHEGLHEYTSVQWQHAGSPDWGTLYRHFFRHDFLVLFPLRTALALFSFGF